MALELKRKSWKDARAGEQSKIVKEMQLEFLNKVKAAESLANQEKVKKKAKKNEKCLQLLEVVKIHGGPITPNDLDRLENLTDKQILNEVKYLRQTVAPNIREKRKVEKKCIKFSKEELIHQIKNALRPENEELGDVDSLLLNSIQETSVEVEDAAPDSEDVGTVAIMEGPLGERKVGVFLTKETIQFYQPSRYGFEPEDLTSELSDWSLVVKIEDFDFISKRTGVYLRCAIRKEDLKK